MFREMRGLEYAFEILRTFHFHPGVHDSRQIAELMKQDRSASISESYVQKILPRMVKLQIFTSSEVGYTLVRPVSEITVDRLLDICDMPDKTSQLYKLCSNLKKSVADKSVFDFYDFSQ